MSKPKKGFHCPTCGARLRVVTTRPRANGIVSRRRQCRSCPYQVHTQERPLATPRLQV